MDPENRPLRPGITERSSSDESGDGSEANAVPERPKLPVKTSCDNCRKGKLGCDSHRTTCTPCAQRDIPCTFEETQGISPEDSRGEDAEKLLKILTNTLLEEDVLAMVMEIRFRNNFQESLKCLTAYCDPRFQGFGTKPQFSQVPDQDSLEFELMIFHPRLFPVSTALDRDMTLVVSTIQKHMVDQPESFVSDTLQRELQHATDAILAISDPRLRQVDFTFWTDAPISNYEAAGAISLYLEIEHPVLNIFDRDLFLNDLSNGEDEFCSRLLVNALLSWACIHHIPLDPRNGELSSSLFEIAYGQWTSGDYQDSFTAVSALQLLSLVATFSGKGEMGRDLLSSSIEMGKRMHLLDCDPQSPPDQDMSNSSGLIAASTAAWGVFCHSMWHCLHCQKCEWWSIKPPTLPLPCEVPGSSSYETASPHLCRLWVIVADILRRYFGPEDDTHAEFDRYNAQFVQTTLKRLVDWGRNLPLSLARGNHIGPDGVIMHIYFHAAILTLFRPLALHDMEFSLGSDSTTTRSARDFVKASLAQLERLVVIYQRHFDNRLSSVLWQTGCLFVANAVIRDTSATMRKLYFYRCLDSYQALYPRHYLMKLIAKGLLGMAYDAGLITIEEAETEIRRFTLPGETRNDEDSDKESPAEGSEPSRVCFVVDLDSMFTRPVEAGVDHLSHAFDEMVLFDMFVSGT